MHLLLTDETNMNPARDASFFVYGGILFPHDALPTLDAKIARIRSEAGFLPGDQFKFATSTRPHHVELDAHTDAKRQVIDLCLAIGVRFIVHVIHHGIIKNQDQDQQVQWAADYVIGRFNTFLSEVGDFGICAVDNLPVTKQFQYLSDKFSFGLQLASGGNVRLDRIKLFAATCINASHANSAMDIVLGSFRYCINNPANIPAAREMMAKVVALMWHRKLNDTYDIVDRGLIIRPPLSRLERDYPTFKPDYDRLIQNVTELLTAAANPIPGAQQLPAVDPARVRRGGW